MGACSRQIYPEALFPGKENKAEKSELKDFMEGGVEKAFDTHSVTLPVSSQMPKKIFAAIRSYIPPPVLE